MARIYDTEYSGTKNEDDETLLTEYLLVSKCHFICAHHPTMGLVLPLSLFYRWAH